MVSHSWECKVQTLSNQTGKLWPTVYDPPGSVWTLIFPKFTVLPLCLSDREVQPYLFGNYKQQVHVARFSKQKAAYKRTHMWITAWALPRCREFVPLSIQDQEVELVYTISSSSSEQHHLHYQTRDFINKTNQEIWGYWQTGFFSSVRLWLKPCSPFLVHSL